MTLKSYLWGMRASTLLALTGYLFVVFRIDPEKSGMAGQLLFYGSMFLFFSGLFIIFFTWLGNKKENGENVNIEHISMSFRQGTLLSFLILILLFFQQKGILTWWDGLLAIAGVFLIELYFLSHRK